MGLDRLYNVRHARRCGGLSRRDGAFLASHPGDNDDEAGGGNVVKERPSPDTVLAFLKRVMTHPRLMNTSKAGEKRAPGRPKTICFADTATAALHLGDKDKWAGETSCPYVEGCRAGLAALGVNDVSFAPVPQALIREIIRGQIEPNMARHTAVLSLMSLSYLRPDPTTQLAPHPCRDPAPS